MSDIRWQMPEGGGKKRVRSDKNRCQRSGLRCQKEKGVRSLKLRKRRLGSWTAMQRGGKTADGGMVGRLESLKAGNLFNKSEYSLFLLLSE